MKTRLYTPGPTMVPEQVSLDMAAPIIHHRTPEFSRILESCHEGLQYLFQTKNPVLMLTCSGTGAMEGAVISVLARSTRTLVVRGGKFGERWGEICAAYGVPFVALDIPWGESVSPDQLDSAMVADPAIGAVCLTQSETSTGALNDIKALAAVVKRRNALCLVDSITGCGVHELRVDDWGIDVAVTGSQKGLMLPPGLAFAALSDEAWDAAKRSDLPSYYLSFQKHRKSWEKTTTPWTPAITLLIGLARALEMVRAEGLEQLWARHQTMGEAMRQAVLSLGLPLFPKTPANVQTVVALPAGLEYSKLSKQLFNVYGMKTAGGQDQLTGKILRIAHLGYLDDGDIIAGASFLERALADLGWKKMTGDAVMAVQKVLARSSGAE